MSLPQVLVIEDDVAIAEAIAQKLRSQAMGVTIHTQGLEGLDAARNLRPDLVILDLNLPDVDGMAICRELQKLDNIPVLMVSARTEESDRVFGLELGADDYLTKPFSLRELAARAHAILRRTGGVSQGNRNDRLVVGDLILDLSQRDCQLEGQTITLTATEFRLLSTLMQRPGQVFSRDQLLRQMSDFQKSDPHLVEVHIANLRAKVEKDPHHPERILTVRSFGYKIAV